MNESRSGELIEQLADIEHQRWSDWQKYVHSKLGFMTGMEPFHYNLDKRWVERWEKQINTPYAELTEQEKESDREQVRRYLPLIEKKLAEAEATGYERALNQLIQLEKENPIPEYFAVAVERFIKDHLKQGRGEK